VVLGSLFSLPLPVTALRLRGGVKARQFYFLFL
jgi:hypothetical protein